MRILFTRAHEIAATFTVDDHKKAFVAGVMHAVYDGSARAAPSSELRPSWKKGHSWGRKNKHLTITSSEAQRAANKHITPRASKEPAASEEAKVKPAASYKWHTYNHHLPVKIMRQTSGGEKPTIISKGMRFGIRKATSAKGKMRLIVKGVGGSKVHTISPGHATRLISRSKSKETAAVHKLRLPKTAEMKQKLRDIGHKQYVEHDDHIGIYSKSPKAIKRVAELLGGGARRQEAAAAAPKSPQPFGPFTWHPTGHPMHGPFPVHMTNNDRKVLQLLASNQGKAHSRGKILKHVYGKKAETYELKMADVYIRSIRRRLAADSGGEHHIQATAGRGYHIGDLAPVKKRAPAKKKVAAKRAKK